MGKSRDLTEFERGMIVGTRIAGCSISETVNRLGFSKTAVSRVYREWCEKQKTSSHRGSCGRKRLVDDSGEKRMERVVEANSHATSVQIQALYNSSGQEKPISLRTTRRTLKRLGYSHRAQRRDSLVLAGLDAIAAYTSCPEQQETSTDLVCSNESDQDPKSQSSTDLVCSNESDQDPRSQSSTDLVCSSESDQDPRSQSSTDLVCSSESDQDPRSQSSTDLVCSNESDRDRRSQSSTDLCSITKDPDQCKELDTGSCVYKTQH